MDKKKSREHLRLWQERLQTNEAAYAEEMAKIDRREELYRGCDTIRRMVRNEKTIRTPHVRNLCAEMIEAQVNSTLPQPRVTARRRADEDKAKIIEDMLRNEMDRLPFEQLNDLMERTVLVQGGGGFLVEWDNSRRTHSSVGELTVSALHPRMILPQDGVYSGIEDMDYLILRIPQTKEYIRRRYQVDVSEEDESEPSLRGDDRDSISDLVTQYTAYYRNDRGGIGLFSWVGDTVLEDLDDYQSRRLRRCRKCGARENELLLPIEPTEDGIPGERTARDGCPFCGSHDFESVSEDYEEVWLPIRTSWGKIPGAVSVVEEHDGVCKTVNVPTRIPYYKPDLFPVILQKNVSLHGRFLGESDVDKIENQQNTTNRIEAKIIDKLLTSGSYITLPDEASIKNDTDEMKVIRPGNAATKSLIEVYDMEGNISQDMAYLAQVYEEARQLIGITDSFQGRQDSTATSGKAKEFAAAQSAGRLESKRVMKDAAYAAIFEAMFKFKLAYADEPRPVVSENSRGDRVYREFNRYDFLEQDAAGEWYWNDQFLFSCDASEPLASNREAMWQETRQNLQSGAFGDPSDIRTLLLFWSKMELLHYPGAGETKAYLEEELQHRMWEEMVQAQPLPTVASDVTGRDSAKWQHNYDKKGVENNGGLSVQ